MSQTQAQRKRASSNNTPLASSSLRPDSGSMYPATFGIKLFRLLIRVVFTLFFKVRVVGLQNVPSTPVIICANHLGWADMFLVLLFLPIEPHIYILGERQVQDISPFRTRIIRWLQLMVPLDRDKPRDALRTMQSILHRGGSLLLFPEGQLGTQEGTILPLQHGAAHLSLSSGVPILPIGLTGTSQLWLRRNLTLRIGQPIDPASFPSDTRTATRTMTTQLEAALRTLLPGDHPHPQPKLLRKWLTHLF